ncbi:hypothetical protein NLM33_02915 [Bradyrhizobium sp. CCGUVB1N3]|uniref:hypothetical protein n=1 Tax=Bradyrhizobium sp. CCGUVB1N3 TaxID=2949629 RepID=UPI0020B29A3E|nr:hypothetical protein [Bradyrhizobium sp. CCGUVB1N3]MCP3469277.1 hypothetical protein [Bradyrhizobium sp. CCGUVB1N3]
MSVVCILTANNSAYHSVRGILLIAAAELDRLGHEVKVLDLEAPDLPARLDALLPRRDETIMICMSGIGLELYTKDQKLFWDMSRIPLFNWNCDHPSYFIRRHRLESRYVVHGYVFPDHAVFSRDHLHTNGAAFATHIGIPDPGFFGGPPAEKRNGRIVFAKSDWNPAKLERSWRETLPPRLFAILFDAIAAARGKNCSAFPEIICTVAAEHLVYLTPGGDVFNAILTRLDNYTRAVRTREVGAVLANYPVDFIGGGWDDFAASSRRARFLGAMPFDALRENLGTYLGAASLNPNVDLSVHDRVFFALGAGTVPIFDANGFSKQHLPRLSRFSFGQDADSVAAAVEAVLDDPAAAQAATATTMAEAYPRFSMRRSVQEICEITTQIAGAAGAQLIPSLPSPAGVWTPSRPTTAAA